MADAVQNPAEFQTVVACDGCGQELNLLTSHILAAVKPQRAVMESMDRALLDAETDDEGNITKLGVDVTSDGDGLEEDRNVYYLGFKKGAGDLVYVHNYDCLEQWASGKGSDKEFQDADGSPRLLALKVDPQAEAREAGA